MPYREVGLTAIFRNYQMARFTSRQLINGTGNGAPRTIIHFLTVYNRDAGRITGFFLRYVFLISTKTRDHDDRDRSDNASTSGPPL